MRPMGCFGPEKVLLFGDHVSELSDVIHVSLSSLSLNFDFLNLLSDVVSLSIFHDNLFFRNSVLFFPTFQLVHLLKSEPDEPPTPPSSRNQEKRRRLRKTLQQAVSKVIIEQRATKAEET